VTSGLSATEWEAFLAGHPQAHILQTAAWGELKASFGWEVVRLREGDSGAQVLFRPFPLGRAIAYVPKGPVGPWLPALLPGLEEACRHRRAFLLKVEPDGDATPETERLLETHGFRPSRQTVQPRRTIVVDLAGSEEELLERMHQKTRYNIGLASRKGVTVRPSDDLAEFAALMKTTASRNRFGAHVPEYYRRAYDLFHPSGSCELLVAEADGQVLAAVIVFARGDRAWYFYGASSDRERQRMPAYLLQWEAMRWARQKGCTHYDLWGIPDAELEQLEAEFATRSDGLWGVYRFKRGFGGRLVRSLGAWDLPRNPILYAAYRWVASAAAGA
jgi:lipid II:glycine glycyltransferase (peptidoglycan interpeptide bridge formation enzyme)